MFYSLRSRLILFFVLLFVLSFGALSFLIFNESRTIIRSYIESSALEKMNEYGSYIDMVQTQIYDLASLVFNSDQTDTWDNIASDTSGAEGEKMLAHIQMSKFLTQTTNSYTSISSVALYRREGVWVSMDNQVIKESSFLDQSWYKQFRDETVRWVPAHTDDVELKIRRSDHPVVSMLMPIGAFEPKQAKTVLKVNVSADYFLEPLSRIHLGESGTMYLIDQHGSPLLTQADYETSASLAKNEVARAQAGRSKQGVVYFRNSQGDAQILVYKKLAQNGWMLVGIVPESDLYAPLLKLRNSIMVLAAALLLISLFLAFWLSNGITQPLSRLVSAMRHVQRGDFDSAESRLPLEGTVRNEVGFATATFRNMIGRLRQHIKTEFELKLLRQQAEYKALLMQINPHFLFNTLELLSSLAMQTRTDDTVKVIESLGKMLRFGLRISDDLVALKEELKYVHDYASILRIRFGDRLWLSMEEDGLPEHAACVKFVLQPLLENAVKYSFAHRTEARVSVRVYRRDSHVVMSVTDNGPGMTEEQIREVLKEAADARPDQILASRERQIGLGNVLARCRLYYGSLFEAHLDSKPGGGTRIELMLPIREVHNDVSLIDRG